MKFVIMYAVLIYLVSCADDSEDHDNNHTREQKIIRAFFWPITLNSWFRSQNGRLHRLLNILWTVLIAGWFLSLLWDRIKI